MYINEFPTTDLIVATQDVSKIGVFNYKLQATESITGLINDTNLFTVTILEPIYTTDLTLVTGTAIADFTYWITETEILTASPRYTPVPANADKQLSYTLDPSTPAFVTLVADPSGIPNVRVFSSSNNDIGAYSISIIVTEFWSHISKTQNFTLTVACVRSIQQFGVIPPTIYYIGDTSIDLTIPLYSLTPASCPYDLQYTATRSSGNPMPNAISLVD